MGAYIGEILGFSLSGFLVGTSPNSSLGGIQIGAWPSVFYLFGLIGILWTPFYFINVYGSPDEHPSITAEEKQLITKGLISSEAMFEEYTTKETEQLRPTHDPEDLSVVSQQSHLTSQTSHSSLRKRLSSVGGAIASESSYTSPIVDSRRRQPNFASLSKEKSPLLNSVHYSAPAHSISLSPDQSTHFVSEPLTYREIPWFAFFTTPESLVLFACHWSCAFVGLFLLSEIPAFLTDELNLCRKFYLNDHFCNIF